MEETAEIRDFEAILRGTQARIRAYIAGMGVAPHEVDDVAQDVYLELYRGFDRMPAEVEPERWLKGIARNVCLNHFRRCSRRRRLHSQALAELLAHTSIGVERLASHDAVGDALDDCVSALPPDRQRIVAMRYRQELSSSAIAAAVDSTAAAVRVALYRIRASLKDCISQKLAGKS